MNRGLASIVSAEPTKDELFLASMRAFELLEAKQRAESRGKWLNQYRYELGELINIARARTPERDVNKLLGVILEKCRFVTGADAGSIYVVESAPDETRGSRPPPSMVPGKHDSATAAEHHLGSSAGRCCASSSRKTTP